MSPRVLLIAWGSRGDVAPFVTLGVGLKDAGYDVSVLASRDFAELVAAAGLGFEAFDADVRALADSPTGRAWLGGHPTIVGEGLALKRVLDEFGSPLIEGLWEHTGDADLLISGVLTADACFSLAAARGQQHVIGLLAPIWPSSNGPSSVAAPLGGRRSAINSKAGYAALRGAYPLISVPGREIRKRLGHGRTSASWFIKEMKATPTLMAVSPHVVPPPPDHRQMKVSGYWAPWSTSSATEGLRDELAAARKHKSVVYLGFGSMTSVDPSATAELLAGAARRSGVHAVIHSGWAGLGEHLIGVDDVTVVDDVPHDWLFAQCDAVVHHGGAGTTASALRAGAPQVVVGHMGDQFYWADRVHRLGVAATPLNRSALSTARLADQITAVTTGPKADTYAADATRVAAMLAHEDGVGNAVKAIQGLL